MAFNFQILGIPSAVTDKIGEYSKAPDNERRGATRGCAEWSCIPSDYDNEAWVDFLDALIRSKIRKIPKVLRYDDMKSNVTEFEISGRKSGRKKKRLKNFWLYHDEAWFNPLGRSSESSPPLDRWR